MRVYHFLPSKWAINDLRNRRLKISKFSDLNDPFEFLNCEIADKDIQKALNETMKEIYPECGVICFSKNWSNPLLWGHYADKHRGVCLGFDIPIAFEVEYILNKKELCAEFERELGNDVEEERIMKKLLLSKYKGWDYEDEVRTFAQLEKDNEENFLNFSSDLNLKQVIMGVRCDKIQDIMQYVDRETEVVQARLDFETFKIY